MQHLECEEHLLCVKITQTKNEVEIQACEREFEILKSVKHPSVVDVKRIFKDPILERVYIVMELVRGVSL